MAGLKSGNVILACLCLVIGAAVMLVAAGIIHVPADSIHAPLWVLGLCGLVFVLAGFMIFAGPKSRFTALGAALLCGSFGLVGAWVSLHSPDGAITGGVPLLSPSTNSTIGRLMFGAGALVSFAIAWAALRQFMRWKDPESDSPGD